MVEHELKALRVRIDSLGDRYWSKTFIEAKRALAMAPTNIARN